MKLIFFALVVFVSFSCERIEQGYPLTLKLQGPYSERDFMRLRDSIWLKKRIDSLWLDEFYIVEVSNKSSEPVYVEVEKYSGIIWLDDFCLQYIEKDFLGPGSRGSIVDYIGDWDSIMPHSTKRYLHCSLHPYNDCDYVQLSFDDLRSSFFDSLNLENPIHYWVGGHQPIRRKHPVFLFRIDEGRFTPLASMDIQKEFDRTMRKMEKLNKRRQLE